MGCCRSKINQISPEALKEPIPPPRAFNPNMGNDRRIEASESEVGFCYRLLCTSHVLSVSCKVTVTFISSNVSSLEIYLKKEVNTFILSD